MKTRLKSFTPMNEEAQHFTADTKGYYAYLRRGLRLDILRVFPFQPEIRDFDDYPTYLFLETLQGFFVLRQCIRVNRAEPWCAILRLEPAEPRSFFTFVCEHKDALLSFIEESAPPPS